MLATSGCHDHQRLRASAIKRSARTSFGRSTGRTIGGTFPAVKGREIAPVLPRAYPIEVSLARRTGIILAGTLVSRILGAARDAVIAATFSLAATDAFFVAFTIPNALRVMLGEGAVAASFVPVFADVRKQEGEERARRFYASLRGAMTLILLAVTALGMLAAPWIVLA